MRRSVKLNKGLNLRLQGDVESETSGLTMPNIVAVTPDDFVGFTPRPEVAEGDDVKSGQPLLRDKDCSDIKLVSPCAGKVKAIVRGSRRKIERVEVEVASELQQSITVDTADVKRALMHSGLWAMMRRRPYDTIPFASDSPRDIFVTALDTAPLAWPLEKAVAGKAAELQAGVDALKQLTKGRIYISVAQGSDFADLQGAETVEFNPLHPAGNPGIQAANLAPVNKGEVVWTLDVVTLARIGALMLTGKVDWTQKVAITGSEVTHPTVVETFAGAKVKSLLEGRLNSDDEHKRVISGNVLTGVPVTEEGYLRYPYRQITVIPEGDQVDEFMGWASMSAGKMSVNRSFIGHFLGMLGRKFSPDARVLGGKRGMIMSGEYDKVLPMDILPEYLIKAIMSRDIDQMEALGIYEVAPEDFALCEYVDPSKLELQQIVRDGLDYLRKEV